MEEELFDEMDMDGSGSIDFHELKVFLTKKYDQMFRK
jgi:Ca2+-binding EF-hand superfamily protein